MKSINVAILTLSQALSSTGAPVVVLLGGIVGAELAPAPQWATLPISLMVVGVAVATIPAALLMKKIGRKPGFIFGALLAGGAALLGAYAIGQGSFFLFCLSAALIGTNSAFVLQYRFAAAESVRPQFAGRAVSLVLVGGIIAGYLGPEIARRTQNLIAASPNSGSFVSIALVYVFAALALAFIRRVDSQEQEQVATEQERPLVEIVMQPTYLMAVLAAAVSYGVMSFIMTATPLQMHGTAGFSIDHTAWVIQSHIIAMYLPSLFSGFLVERLGVVRVMLAGLVMQMACVGLGIISRELLHYWGALVLLGLGWNFLFVGGTVLLTRSYRSSERFKSQAANDFTVFGIQALASLSAGSVLFSANWDTLNLIAIPFLVLVLGTIVIFWRRLSYSPALA